MHGKACVLLVCVFRGNQPSDLGIASPIYYELNQETKKERKRKYGASAVTL